MAHTYKYLNHLLQRVGITPAGSEEERAAAELVAGIYRSHGFEPEIQEFSAPTFERLPWVIAGALIFIGAVLSFFGIVWTVVGMLFAAAGAALGVLDKLGRIPDSLRGSSAPSQNVIAYHKAEGPLASPRNRPVVVVAHYDSPRTDLLCRPQFAAIRPMLLRALPVAVVVPAVLVLLSLFPFPGPASMVFKVLAVVVSLVPLFYAVTVVMNRFALPYTTGSVCNKSSVAAMLGVMNAVAPFGGESEFPDDIPFDEYRERFMTPAAVEQFDEDALDGEEVVEDDPDALAAEMAAAASAEAAVQGAVPEEGEGILASETSSIPLDKLGATSQMGDEDLGTEVISGDEVSAAEADAEISSDEEDEIVLAPDLEPEEPSIFNAHGNVRHGEELVRSLNMVPERCTLVYEDEGGHGKRPEGAASASGRDGRPAASPDSRETRERDADFREVDDSELAAAANAAADAESTVQFQVVPAVPVDADIEPFGSVAPASADAADEAPEDDVPELSEVSDGVEVDGTEREDASPVADDRADGSEPHVERPSRPHAVRKGVQSSLSSFDPSELDTPVSFGVEFAAAAAVEEAEPEEASAGQVVFEPAAPEAAPSAPVRQPASAAPDSTQLFSADQVRNAQDAAVDALMEQISPRTSPASAPRPAPAPASPAAQPSSMSEGVSASSQSVNPLGRRASLFDLPDPSASPSDPFAAPASATPSADATALYAPAPSSRSAFEVVDAAPASNMELPPLGGAAAAPSAPAGGLADLPVMGGGSAQPAGDGFDVITSSAPAPASASADKPRRGLGRLFGKKKRKEESMSEWLGVDDDFDARTSGRDIGSWDNFEDDSWKGGAAAADGVSEEEMVDAIASLGDDELLGHDIWFVATGASAAGNTGMRMFLEEHRDKLRGVFVINLESVGAGEVAVLTSEGSRRVYRGDRRIVGLLNRVSNDFHRPFLSVDMPNLDTDAAAAMKMSLRAATIAGVEGGSLACSHHEGDLPENIDPENVNTVADVVTEVIRRS